MKIIVTGALGHIGSKLIRDLPNFIKDLDIAMIDNFTTQNGNNWFWSDYCNKFINAIGFW